MSGLLAAWWRLLRLIGVIERGLCTVLMSWIVVAIMAVSAMGIALVFPTMKQELCKRLGAAS